MNLKNPSHYLSCPQPFERAIVMMVTFVLFFFGTYGYSQKYSIEVLTDKVLESSGNIRGFRVYRESGPVRFGLTEINYSISGSADDADYEKLSGKVVIPFLGSEAFIYVEVIDDDLIEGDETITITLEKGDGYKVTKPKDATLTILDNDLGTVSVIATKPKASEPSTNGSFQLKLSMVNHTGKAIRVNYVLSGSAEEDKDYEKLTPAGFVTFPDGSDIVDIEIKVIEDGFNEDEEDVTLTLTGTNSDFYTVGPQNMATVTITDSYCLAGNIAPVLDASVPTAFCGIISQDLNEYTNSVPPAGTALTWSTNRDPSITNAHIFSDVDAPGTYYGFFYDAVDNCGSPVLTVNLTINETPGKVEQTTPGSICGQGSVTLQAIRNTPGTVLNWYDRETGGTFLGTGTSFVTPSIAETTTFYVEATANGCTSERTAVIATVYEQPNPGVANNTSACSLAEGFTTVDLNTRLVGADPGVWTITSVPTGSTVTIGPNNIVDFVGQPDGDYIFTYTTNTAQAPCTDPSTTLTVSVSPSDCAPDDIDLELVKQVDKGSVDVGGQVTFTLALTNLSDIQATNIIVSDPLGISYGFPYVASTPSKGTYNNITGEWAIDVLEPHESISLILVASVPVEGTFTNMAMITASFPNDGNPANNESSVEVEVLSTVCLQIFNQISPNGDGINDEFIINCIRNYKNNKLEIFDRYGNKVFSKTNYDNTWSGTGKNGDLPKGTYFYSLDLGDGSAGKTGWIQIIR